MWMPSFWITSWPRGMEMEMGAGEDGDGMWNLKETVSRARKGLRRQNQNCFYFK